MKEQNKKYLDFKKIKRQVKGITLIALVITIIVLLILAGVAINLTIGQNGIFSRTQIAANTWRNAESNEQLALGEGADLIDEYLNENGGGAGEEYNTGKTVSDAKNQNKFFKEDTTIQDDLLNDVRVPEGFKIAQDSATKVENGIVIEDKVGNQFVWIPAKTGAGVTIHTEAKGDVTIVYKRTDYGYQTGNYSNYSETLPTDEEISLIENGGYYIGRFEAGDEESTKAKTMRTGTTQDRTVTIKKDQVPYNYILQYSAQRLAEEMSTVQGYKAKTKLVSSYAWDTAISLIQITNADYATKSNEGNYSDTKFTYTDISGIQHSKNGYLGVLIPTGQSTAVSNIYDMGGNIFEYTSETEMDQNGRGTASRGGGYSLSSGISPAGYREVAPLVASDVHGFRIALFI